MDRKELIERLQEYSQSWAAYNDHELSVALQDAATAIETLLAEREKAVEVVRCKDCKNYILTGRPPFMYYACNRLGAIRVVDEDDFCKYGTPPESQQTES